MSDDAQTRRKYRRQRGRSCLGRYRPAAAGAFLAFAREALRPPP